MNSRYAYLLWAARHWWLSDTSCPACHAIRTRLVKRKYLVTGLYRCEQCRLMFRVPKTGNEEHNEYYQKKYQQGFTTNCPDDHILTDLMRRQFKGTEKD